MAKFYTGIGSRQTPKDILMLMTTIARKLAALGWTLRSGGADGADSAFESGAGLKNIYLAHHATPASTAIAARFHPAWNRCSEFARKLHGRNSFQVLGSDLNTPSSFLLCWTQDGCTCHADRTIKTGGTGTAISIADHFGVPVFNLARVDHLARLFKFIG